MEEAGSKTENNEFTYIIFMYRPLISVCLWRSIYKELKNVHFFSKTTCIKSIYLFIFKLIINPILDLKAKPDFSWGDIYRLIFENHLFITL